MEMTRGVSGGGGIRGWSAGWGKESCSAALYELVGVPDGGGTLFWVEGWKGHGRVCVPVTVPVCQVQAA